MSVQDMPGWAKATSAAVVIAIAWQAFKHFQASDNESDRFFRKDFIETTKSLTEATSANTEVSRQQTSALQTVAVELRDQRRSFEQLTNRIDRLLSRGWESNRTAPE